MADSKEARRRYYLRHRDRILAAKRVRDLERKAEISAYNAEYYRQHKAEFKERCRKNRKKRRLKRIVWV